MATKHRFVKSAMNLFSAYSEVLLTIFIVLVVITLVGHGIWVLLALIFTGGRSLRKDLTATDRSCPFCGRTTPRGRDRCEWCGRDLKSLLAREMDDLEALQRQLNRFRTKGTLKEDVLNDLCEQVRHYRQQLLHPVDEVVAAEIVEEPEEVAPPTAPSVEAPPGIKPPIRPREVPVSVKPSMPQVAVPQAAEREEPVAKPQAAVPRRSFGEMLAAFMEERNIRWGELVGGLLIVGSSIALVLSLWPKIEAIPYSPFLIFATGTAAFFGVGLYAHHRWKLEATSHGLLIIATLMVPLIFWVMAAFPNAKRTTLTLLLEIASLGVFSYLVSHAARALLPKGRWAPALMVLGVLGNSAMVLLTPRLIDEHSPVGWLVFSGCLPAAVFVAAIWGYLLAVSPRKQLDTNDAAAMLAHVGLAFFALATAFGLLVKTAVEEIGMEAALECLSVPLALMAFPLAVSGLRIARGMTDDDEAAGGYQVAGTAIALLGISLMITALGLAWPQPMWILVVGAINSAGLIYMAFRYDFPLGHAGAMVCMAIAYLAGFHWLFDERLQQIMAGVPGLHGYDLRSWIIALSVSAKSGQALVAMFILYAVISEWLVRSGRGRHGIVYAGGCAAVAVFSLMLVALHSLFNDSLHALSAAILFGVYGIGTLAMVARWRKAELSYVGLGLAAAAPLWLMWYLEKSFDPLWATILGAETVAMGIAAAVLYRLYPSEDPDAWKVEVRMPESGPLVNFYRVPLLRAADFLATLAIGTAAVAHGYLALRGMPADYLGWSAVTAVCVSAFYLLVACGQRSQQRFIMHQVMLAVAVLLGTTSWLIWLINTHWPSPLPGFLFNPHCLYLYGITLGLFALGYAAARISLRGNKVFSKLLKPALLNRNWVSVDWVVRHGVIWLMLLVVAVGSVWPGVCQELLGQSGPLQETQLAAVGAHAWILLAVLAVVMIVALWEKWGREELVGAVLLGATLACLVAGQFAGVKPNAVASAARWALATVFLLGSVAVWNRKYLLAWCRQARTQVDVGSRGARAARTTLLATAAAPVLGLTLLAAWLQFLGTTPGGPAANTFFGNLGLNISYVVPLLLVMGALVGYAIRERLAGYAFAAGLVAEMIVTLGYCLSVRASFEWAEFVTLCHLATITVAVWAGAWLVARRWLNIWRETPESHSARIMMNVQIGMGIAGNGFVIGIAIAIVVLLAHSDLELPWVATAGNLLGWIALSSVVAAGTYRRIQAGKVLRPQMVGLVGMTAIGLLACTVAACAGAFQYDAAWAYRTLMLGWAMYALLIVSATWWVASQRTLPEAQGPPQALIRLAATWVRVAGILAVLLGVKAALFHAQVLGEWEDMLWAALAISIASLAGATMAVWRRQEGWAFPAALGVNLAASLVVWYVFRHFAEWRLELLQANVIASAAVALVWLAVRKRLYELRELTLGRSPLLAAQVTLPVIGNILVLMVPLVWLMQEPQYLAPWMVNLAEGPGWIALLLSAAAAAWYVRQTLASNLVHVLAGLGLGAGVLIACHAGNFTVPWDGNWLEYHTLIAAWTAVAGVLLVLGMLARRLRFRCQDATPGSSLFLWKASSTATGPRLVPPLLVQSWVTVIGSAVLGLSLIYAHADMAGIWWHFGAIAALSLMAGTVAVWGRQAAYVFISGLMINVIGTLAWWYWGRSVSAPLVSLIETNVICLAIASAAWAILDFLPSVRVPYDEYDRRPILFAHIAAQAGVVLLFAMAAGLVANELVGTHHLTVHPLGWIAVLATAAALAISLWDRRAKSTLTAFYFLGLATVAMEWVYREFPSGKFLAWVSVAEVSGFVLAAGAIGWVLPRMQRARALLRIPGDEGRWPVEWFTYTQAFLAAVAAVLTIWTSIDYSFDGMGAGYAMFGLTGRRSGPMAALMLLGAAVVMAWQTKDRWRAGWQYAAFAAGMLLSSSFGWMRLDASEGTATGDLPWLHRSVSLMVSAAMMTLLSGFGLGKVLPRATDWIERGRRAVPWLGSLAIVMLMVVLAQEVSLLISGTEVAMATSAVLIVAVALAGLAAGCIALAVIPRLDPLGLSERGRTAYVYVAEALVGLTCLHLGLTRWYWFDFGIIRGYWMLIVLLAAFGGAALSELFHRRKLPVLSEPLERTALFLPLAPMLGFWFVHVPETVFNLSYANPGIWLVVGMFYGVMAVRKQSIVLAAVGILAANTGLWVLWYRQGWNFIEHPQLWLIPVALVTLVAEQLDRGRLNSPQRAGIRYVAMSVIYLSSTFEFMRGIEQSVHLTLITVALAVLGVLAGILLRGRSFLYLGVACLSVVIVRLIYFGAFERGQMWLLWSCLIALGLAIILLFAIFEKYRNDVLARVERFKQWEE